MPIKQFQITLKKNQGVQPSVINIAAQDADEAIALAPGVEPGMVKKVVEVEAEVPE